MFYLKTWLLTALTFLGLDLLWLGVLMKDTYRKEFGAFLADKPNLPAAVIVYLALTIGLIVFILPRVFPNGTPKDALVLGALFGLVTYATYEFTNLALVKNWPLKIAIIDTLWGVVLCGLGALAMFYAAKWVG